MGGNAQPMGLVHLWPCARPAVRFEEGDWRGEVEVRYPPHRPPHLSVSVLRVLANDNVQSVMCTLDGMRSRDDLSICPLKKQHFTSLRPD